jgi:hypothetical protein
LIIGDIPTSEARASIERAVYTLFDTMKPPGHIQTYPVRGLLVGDWRGTRCVLAAADKQNVKQTTKQNNNKKLSNKVPKLPEEHLR